MNYKKFAVRLLFGLLLLAVIVTPVVFAESLWFPFATSKGIFLESALLLALPVYVYLLFIDKKSRPDFKNPLTALILVFAAISIIAGIFGVNPTRSFWGTYQRMTGNFELLNFVLLYFYVLALAKNSEKFLEILLKALVWTGFAAAVYGILEKSLGLNWFPDSSLPVRISGTFGSPTFFAAFLTIPLFLAIFFAAQRQSRQQRYFYFAAAFAQAIGIYLSGTRGSFLGFLAGLAMTFAVYLYFRAKNKKINRTHTMLAAAAVILAACGYFYLTSNSRLSSFEDNNARARLIQWGMALKGFKDRPVLGTGPENYYVIANKYFNPELYKYDSSSFDKPHNYLLEILDTTGLLGLLAYLGILFFCAKNIFTALKQNYTSVLGAAALLGGLLAYQLQNFFIFEVQVSGLTFFIFLAFCGFFSELLLQKDDAKKQPPLSIKPAAAAGGICLAFCIYVFFVYDLSTVKVLQEVNKNYAKNQTDLSLAQAGIENIFNSNFVYGKAEVLGEIADYASALPNGQGQDPKAVNQIYGNITARLKEYLKRNGNDPIYWNKLGILEVSQANYNNTRVSPDAEPAIQKAVGLAPGRYEPLQVLVLLKLNQQKFADAVGISKQITEIKPGDPDLTWRLAVAYQENGQMEQAVETAGQAQALGYQFKSLDEFAWLINYYADKRDYNRVIDLDLQALKLDPANKSLYNSLFISYSNTGKPDEAKKVLGSMPK